MPQTALLKARPEAGKEIEIKLTWKRPGLIKRVISGEIDLDLGCYYRLADGKSLLIDALQFSNGGGTRDVPSRQGCLTEPPYIWHTGNDHGTGAHPSESLLVNAEHLDAIDRMVVYAYVYDGQACWDDAEVELTVRVPGADPYVLPLGRTGAAKRFCTLAEISMQPGSVVEVKESVAFFDGHADCDSHYGWGFRYRK